MSVPQDVQDLAQRALAQMRAAGFEHAQVSAIAASVDEVNVNDNEPTLMRSGETRKLSLMGIVDGRMASTETAELDDAAVAQRIADLFRDAQAAPQDAANAVSTGQQVRLVQGPQEADTDAAADAVGQLLAYREAKTPRAWLSLGWANHRLQQSQTLTTGGSDLQCSIGFYEVMAEGVGRDGDKSSSFAFAQGYTDDLRVHPVVDLFGLGEMLRNCERLVETRPFDAKFTGDVVLTPKAVQSLLGWLFGQLGDAQLIAGSSLYRDKVGQPIASPLLTLRSRFDAPGVAAISADAFATAPVTVLEAGVLRSLTPSLYGSRKTGLPHVPVAPGAGWEIQPGSTPLPELVGGVRKGALVDYLSMGMPAANGDFSAVIKNSFAIEGGEVGHGLSEVMINGNMAQMLREIVAVSRETQEGPGCRLPWLRVGGLHFS